MSDLDFYAHAAAGCALPGAGIGASPADWKAALGPGRLDTPHGTTLRRDYGLLEALFARTPAGTMACLGFGVRIHRLVHGRAADLVPPMLARRYGSFAPRVRFERLRAAISATGRTVELTSEEGDLHHYRVPETGARLLVTAGPDPSRPGRRRAGDVRSIDVRLLDVSQAW
ncbi:hypothetical protein [Kitasatospora sp. NPDC088346]|uniref:hypothetical protein n=1 Tax=Kitasatospora sp. NPDC088346 TaxID=3364073 RepID=UPI0038063E81